MSNAVEAGTAVEAAAADYAAVLALLSEIRASQLRTEAALASVVADVKPLVTRVQTEGVLSLLGARSPFSALLGR